MREILHVRKAAGKCRGMGIRVRLMRAKNSACTKSCGSCKVYVSHFGDLIRPPILCRPISKNFLARFWATKGVTEGLKALRRGARERDESPPLEIVTRIYGNMRTPRGTFFSRRSRR